MERSDGGGRLAEVSGHARLVLLEWEVFCQKSCFPTGVRDLFIPAERETLPTSPQDLRRGKNLSRSTDFSKRSSLAAGSGNTRKPVQYTGLGWKSWYKNRSSAHWKPDDPEEPALTAPCEGGIVTWQFPGHTVSHLTEDGHLKCCL